LHTPDEYPRSELRRVLATAGRADLGPGSWHGAQLGDGHQAARAVRTWPWPAL